MICTGHASGKTLIILAGPTASGKTDLAIDLALTLKTEIISFDSRQFYREMRIGTAVPSPDQLAAVPHHFIQHVSIHQGYDVAVFESDALAKLAELFDKYDVVVAVGGSGLYIHALMYGLDKLPGRDAGIREQLANRLEAEGLPALQAELARLDPVCHARVDLNNPRRLIRALEVCLLSGRPYSSFRMETPRQRPFDLQACAIELDRSLLHHRISQRVEKMLEEGLVTEAITLMPYRHLNALQTLGYQEVFRYLDGEISLGQATADIKTNTRRYARRQITWFRRDVMFEWLGPDQLRDKLLS